MVFMCPEVSDVRPAQHSPWSVTSTILLHLMVWGRFLWTKSLLLRYSGKRNWGEVNHLWSLIYLRAYRRAGRAHFPSCINAGHLQSSPSVLTLLRSSLWWLHSNASSPGFSAPWVQWPENKTGCIARQLHPVLRVWDIWQVCVGPVKIIQSRTYIIPGPLILTMDTHSGQFALLHDIWEMAHPFLSEWVILDCSHGLSSSGVILGFVKATWALFNWLHPDTFLYVQMTQDHISLKTPTFLPKVQVSMPLNASECCPQNVIRHYSAYVLYCGHIESIECMSVIWLILGLVFVAHNSFLLPTGHHPWDQRLHLLEKSQNKSGSITETQS